MAIEYITPQGGTDVTTYATLKNGSGNLVTGETAANISLAYIRPLDASATTVAATSLAGPDAAHADGGFVEVDGTNMPGLYRIDWPDALAARGENFAIVTINSANIARVYGILNLDPEPSVIQGAVNDTGATDTSFDTDLAGSYADAVLEDSFLLFVNGFNANAVEQIIGYTDTNGTITTNAFPSAPNDGDDFIIVNR